MKVFSPTILLNTLEPCEGKAWSMALGTEMKERLEKASYPVLDVEFEPEPGIIPGGCARIRLIEIDPMTRDHWLINIPVAAHESAER